MADDSVTITFSADTAQLDAAIARAKAQLAGFSSEMANFTRQVNDSAQIGNFQGALEGVGAEAKILKSAVAEARRASVNSPAPGKARAQSWPEPASQSDTSRAKYAR